MVDKVTIPYERVFEHPLDEAFTWLTDYRDDDTERAGAISKARKVLEEREDEVLVELEQEILGRTITGMSRVELDPPNAWTADVEDDEGRLVGHYEYRLEEHPDGCKLQIDYNVVTPRLRDKLRLWLTKPLVRRQIDEMWDGYESAMDRELAEKTTA